MEQEAEVRGGIDAAAYALRQQGCSPEPIRQAAWQLIGAELSGTVLDAGSGGGGWIRYMLTNSRVQQVISVDIVDDGASQLPGVEFHLTDLSYGPLPCASGSLDWLTAIEVIEHLANPRHLLKEAARCLRPGGRMLITTPCNESLRAKVSFFWRGYFPAFNDHDYQGSGHITPLTELDLRRMAAEAGFSDIRFFYPLPGRIPKLTMEWRSLLPWLTGKWWSDGLFALLTR